MAGLALAAGLMIGTNVVLVTLTLPASVLFLAATPVLAVVYHVAGGYVAAAIARDHTPAIVALVICGTLLLLSSVVRTWSQMPPWYSLAMVVIVPASLWLGTWVHRRRQGQAGATPRNGRSPGLSRSR